jgi:predicted ATPase
VQVLLERAGELRALSAALQESLGGSGTTVLVGGEAGSGKSTLAAHFLATAPCRVLRSGCDGATTAAPLGPLVDVAAALGVDLPAEADTPVDRVRLFAAARAALAAEPTVWLVEDLH